MMNRIWPMAVSVLIGKREKENWFSFDDQHYQNTLYDRFDDHILNSTIDS